MLSQGACLAKLEASKVCVWRSHLAGLQAPVFKNSLCQDLIVVAVLSGYRYEPYSSYGFFSSLSFMDPRLASNSIGIQDDLELLILESPTSQAGTTEMHDHILLQP